jgi:hypothetical protein
MVKEISLFLIKIFLGTSTIFAKYLNAVFFTNVKNRDMKFLALDSS